MRLRQLVLACGLASLALSSHVSALGLGEVKLKSTLNQPLEAEVKLLDTRDLTAEQILVTLASPADFERNGVDRLFFYTEFQFTVDLESPDGPKVLITSRNPVREPYLNFLIEARWTAGRLLREYTLLMDLPTFDEGAVSRPVQSATTSAPKQARQSTTAPTSYVPSTRSTSGSGNVSPQPKLSGSDYEVRNNDTLWEIALRARPDSSVSVHQSMMALYKANPDAFIGGNINRLRRGQVLRIPDAEEMKSLGKSEAVRQFAAANNGDSELGAQINASRRASTARTESTEVSGRVKLAAPSADNGSGQGSGANDGSGKALETELATTLEELDKSKEENTELSSRVRDLEAQIETMQRLVDVSNEKLRALQVAAEQKPADVTPSQPPVEQPVVPAGEPVASSQQSASVASQEAITPVTPVVASSSVASSAPAVVPPPVQPNKVVTRPKPQPTLMDKVKENAPWIGLGVLGLAGAGYFAYRRRKQAAEEQALDEQDVFSMDEVPVEIDEAEEAPDNFDEIDESSLFDEERPVEAVAETGDVVGEADIYIAYGKLDQAEEMLLNALKKDPDSTDIRMKLLEVYAQQQNVASFDKQYAALLPIAGAALLSRAAELRAGISGAGEFDAGIGQSNESADDFALDDFNLDDDLSVSEEQPAPANYQASDFDFQLDLDDDEPSKATADLSPAADEFSLDLDEDSEVKETDDLSELSLALDELDKDVVPDLEATSTAIDDEFSFDLDDDLALDDDLSADDDLELSDELADIESVDGKHEQEASVDGSLDVPTDDFNLDMNVDDIDLAALDHEMESLDVDFEDEALGEDSPSISDFAAQEIAKDEAEFDLDDLDEDMQLEDLAPSSLNLTDDLDSPDETISFDLEDEKTLDAEIEADFAALDSDASSDLADLELDEELPSEPATAERAAHDEDLFSQALSEFSTGSDDLDLNEFSSDEAALADLSDDEMDSELDFLADADEAATKLDLARAYIDMGDAEGAKDILSEVMNEGNEEQRKEANELLGRIV
jgi:pilus assembly protein FimV